MSDEIAVILELTQYEAVALRSLLLRGVDWSQSGEFGKTIAAIYDSLSDLVPTTPNYTPHQQPSSTYLVWKKL